VSPWLRPALIYGFSARRVSLVGMRAAKRRTLLHVDRPVRIIVEGALSSYSDVLIASLKCHEIRFSECCGNQNHRTGDAVFQTERCPNDWVFSWCSSVAQPTIRLFESRLGRELLSTASELAVRPIEPSVKCITWLSPRIKRLGLKADHSVPIGLKLMRRAVPPFIQTSFWLGI
jgi:hypothetical protein